MRKRIPISSRRTRKPGPSSGSGQRAKFQKPLPPPKGKKKEKKTGGKKGGERMLLRSRKEGHLQLKGRRSNSGSSSRGRGSSSSRGRGRPTPKGPYTGARASTQRVMEGEAEHVELRETQSILDPAYELPISTKAKMRKKMEEVQEAVEDVPTPDVAARALENITRVVKVSTASQGLKGTLQASLRDAAASLSAMVSLLAKRAQLSPEEKMKEEMRTLREELRVSRTQVAQAQAEVAGLGKQIEELKG